MAVKEQEKKTSLLEEFANLPVVQKREIFLRASDGQRSELIRRLIVTDDFGQATAESTRLIAMFYDEVYLDLHNEAGGKGYWDHFMGFLADEQLAAIAARVLEGYGISPSSTAVSEEGEEAAIDRIAGQQIEKLGDVDPTLREAQNVQVGRVSNVAPDLTNEVFEKEVAREIAERLSDLKDHSVVLYDFMTGIGRLGLQQLIELYPEASDVWVRYSSPTVEMEDEEDEEHYDNDEEEDSEYDKYSEEEDSEYED